MVFCGAAAFHCWIRQVGETWGAASGPESGLCPPGREDPATVPEGSSRFCDKASQHRGLRSRSVFSLRSVNGQQCPSSGEGVGVGLGGACLAEAP